MCGRFFVPEEEGPAILRAIMEELSRKGTTVKTGEIFPGDVAAVIAMNRRLEPRVFAMEWGYRAPGGRRIINARSETAAQKPMFADGMRHRRCLIPAVNYFEWERSSGGRTKYAIAPQNSEGFFLAGLYRLEDGKPVFTILTRAPASSIAFIHDRMPVMIPQSAAGDWLDPRVPGETVLEAAVSDVEYRRCDEAVPE